MSDKVQIYLTNLIVPTSQRSTTVSAGTIPVVLASDYDALLAKYEAILPLARVAVRILDRGRAEEWRACFGVGLLDDDRIETDLARRGREAIGGEG